MDMRLFVHSLTMDEINQLHIAVWEVKRKFAKDVAKPLSPEEKILADCDRFVDAIKMYRGRMGCSLLEAKIAVEVYLERV